MSTEWTDHEKILASLIAGMAGACVIAVGISEKHQRDLSGDALNTAKLARYTLGRVSDNYEALADLLGPEYEDLETRYWSDRGGQAL
jgi:hypothetical protein